MFITTTSRKFRARARSETFTITYEETGRFTPADLTIPIELFATCEGASDDLATFTRDDGNRITAQWTDNDVPRTATCETGPPANDGPWPPVPRTMRENPSRLLEALHEAGESTDHESSRFALGHIQLRGARGEIVATDGYQLLVERGFEFPWSEDLLIAPSSVVRHAELTRNEQVGIGCADGWVTLSAGPWTLQFQVLKNGRFPKTDGVIPHADRAVASCRLLPAELEQLAKSLKLLPASDDRDKPMTIDLNGHFAVRARSAQQEEPVELKLAKDRPTGRPMRIASNRQFLERAARLGLGDIHLYSPNSSLLAEGELRQLVWMPLHSSLVIPPQDAGEYPHFARRAA